MGIGKIAFLDFVDEAFGGTALPATGDRIVRGDYFACARLGLGFVKPSSWHFHAFEDFLPRLAGQELKNGLHEDPVAYRREAENLVVVISRDPVREHHDGETARFTPSITIFSNAEARADEDFDFHTTVFLAIEGFGEMLREYSVLVPPSFLQISACIAARFTAQFVFEHRGMRPVLLRDQTLMIDQGDRVYTVHLYDSPETGLSLDREFEIFLGSLHLA